MIHFRAHPEHTRIETERSPRVAAHALQFALLFACGYLQTTAFAQRSLESLVWPLEIRPGIEFSIAAFQKPKPKQDVNTLRREVSESSTDPHLQYELANAINEASSFAAAKPEYETAAQRFRAKRDQTGLSDSELIEYAITTAHVESPINAARLVQDAISRNKTNRPLLHRYLAQWYESAAGATAINAKDTLALAGDDPSYADIFRTAAEDAERRWKSNLSSAQKLHLIALQHAILSTDGQSASACEYYFSSVCSNILGRIWIPQQFQRSYADVTGEHIDVRVALRTLIDSSDFQIAAHRAYRPSDIAAWTCAARFLTAFRMRDRQSNIRFSDENHEAVRQAVGELRRVGVADDSKSARWRDAELLIKLVAADSPGTPTLGFNSSSETGECVVEAQVQLRWWTIEESQWSNLAAAARTVLKMDPTHHNAFAICALDSFRKGKWKDLEAIGRERLSQDNRRVGRIVLAVGLAKQRKYGDALAVLKGGPVDSRDQLTDKSAWLIEANLQKCLNQGEEAIGTIEALWRKDRGDLLSAYHYALLLAEGNDKLEAISVLSPCLRSADHNEVYSDELISKASSLAKELGIP